METQSIGSMVKILSEAIGQQANRSGKEFNLTMQQIKILHYLRQRAARGETTMQKDIQNHMHISHPTTVNMLRLMREKGFIEIYTSEKDKRMKIVALTGKEACFAKKIARDREQIERRLVAGLTRKEQNDLRRYLQQMYENMTSDNR